MKKLYPLFLSFILIFLMVPCFTVAQNFINNSSVSGSFQVDGQYYIKDKKMGITDSMLDGRLTRMNGFTEINYSYKNFNAGMRFEAYLPPLVGYDIRNEGAGIPYWFVNYKNDKLDITAGNFYEQFGNGMSLRTWQEWNLGFDNSLRGLKVKFAPVDGLTFKGVWGVQRNYWEAYTSNARGIVKGGDVDIYFNDLFPKFKDSKTKLTLGGSFVSDYQKGKTLDLLIDTTVYAFKLPENVSIYGGRINLNIGGFSLYSEYMYKINDPSSMNKFIYKNGNGLYTSFSYSRKGLGVQLSAKIIDNMSYKSNRYVTNNQLDINYLPAITKQHTYALASMYPYATQPNGEYGYSGQFSFAIPRKTTFGKYTGMTFELNFSRVTSIKKDTIPETNMNESGTLGYKTNFFIPGKDLYYQDLNFDITSKFSKKWKGILTLLQQIYNKDVVEGHLNEYGLVHAFISISDVTWNITTKYSLRGELQGLWSKQDKGNWLAGLLELTISPTWFFSIQDQWNYGNTEKNQQLHYYLISAGYTYNTSRIALSYGRQREGILCVGGVCRYVPAASGLTLTLTSSF